MTQTLRLLLGQLAGCLRSRAELELENLVLRHQIEILRRSAPQRARLVRADRFIFTLALRLWPRIAQSIRIVHPKTVVRWHREGFRIYWRWRSRSRKGRPKASGELRVLIRQMCSDNPLWGAPRIHGELLKLGFDRFPRGPHNHIQAALRAYRLEPRTAACRAFRHHRQTDSRMDGTTAARGLSMGHGTEVSHSRSAPHLRPDFPRPHCSDGNH